MCTGSMECDHTAVMQGVSSLTVEGETVLRQSKPKGVVTRSSQLARSTKWRILVDPYVRSALEALGARLNNFTCSYIHIWVYPSARDQGPDLLCDCHVTGLTECHCQQTTIRGYFETMMPMTLREVEKLVGIPCTLYKVEERHECTTQGLLFCKGDHIFNEYKGLRRVHVYPEGYTVFSYLQNDGRRVFVKTEHWGHLSSYSHLQSMSEFDYFYDTYRCLKSQAPC
jgi:hypothetical protein